MPSHTEAATFLVVGESLIDVVESGGRRTETVGGSPANVALGLARLGRSVRFHTALGRDVNGEHIAAYLRGAGVRVDEQSWCLSATSTAAATIRPDGSADYLFEIEPTLAGPHRQGEPYVHVGSISAFMPPGAEAIARLLAHLPEDVIVSFDPNIRSVLIGSHRDAVLRFEQIVRRATVVKLSDVDAQWLYPGWHIDAVIDHVLAMDTPLVAVTRGPDGSTIASPHARAVTAAPTVTAKDTVGAGDTFMAALLDATVEDADLLRGAGEAALTAAGARSLAVRESTPYAREQRVISRTPSDLAPR